MNCIIVDDEYPAIAELSYFIKNFSHIRIIGEFDNSADALKFIRKTRCDVVFLDINMPNMDGISFAKIINSFEVKPILIFITAYMEYALEAFEVQAFDYILKPFSEERIISTLRKVENLKDKGIQTNKITLWKGGKMMVVPIDDIYYCEASEREVLVFTSKDKFIITSTISDFYKKLPKNKFYKCHRSYIVNLDKITEIIPWFNNTYVIKVGDLDFNIPVSRNNMAEFKTLMGI